MTGLARRALWSRRAWMRLAMVLALLCEGAAAPAVAARGDIQTYAGGGAGDRGPAAAALIYPSDVALDRSGNIFLADSSQHRIREIDHAGSISTRAGFGAGSLFGDSGPATGLGLYVPSGLTVDDAGNIYIADTLSNRVRRVDRTGRMVTIAGQAGQPQFAGDGGPATSARLADPTDVAIDPGGNLYIADGSRIRRVEGPGTPLAGTISTYAGGGVCALCEVAPANAVALGFRSGIAVDSAGDLLIADSFNHRVRKVDHITRLVRTIAGTGIAGFSGDGGPATAATLKSPSNVAEDAAGNLYIADRGSRRLRRVDHDGVITTVAGTGAAEFAGDGGPALQAAVDPRGVAVDAAVPANIYIADGSRRLRRVDAGGMISTVAGVGDDRHYGDAGPADRAKLSFPNGIRFDNSGNLYIAENNHSVVRKVTPAGTITTVAGSGEVGFAGDGGPATGAKLANPRDVAADADGNLYIADRGNQRIRKVDAAGIITTVAGDGTAGYSGDGGPAAAASLNAPRSVSVDAAGDLYVADEGNSRVRRIARDSGIITTVAGNGSAVSTGDGGPAASASLNSPRGIFADPAGSLYIAELAAVRRVDAAGTITTVAGSATAGYSGDGGPATAAQLNGPTAIATDGRGSLYIADQLNDRIRKVNPAGTISTIAGNGEQFDFGGFFGGNFFGDGGPAEQAALNLPAGLALDGSGNVFIGDSFNHRVRVIEMSAPADTTPPVTTVALDPATPDGPEGFYRRSVHATLSSTDEGGSGVAFTEYSVDGGDYRTYKKPFLLAKTGEHIIRYRSTDRAGNHEPAKATTVRIRHQA